jgi:hypothetical protein
LRKKAAEERSAQESTTDFTRYDLTVGEEVTRRLYKRQLFLAVVRALINKGKSVQALQEILPQQKFVGISGNLSGAEFRAAVAEMRTASGASYSSKRYYFDDGDLFVSDGKTWALSKHWTIDDIPLMDRLLASFPDVGISYSTSVQD